MLFRVMVWLPCLRDCAGGRSRQTTDRDLRSCLLLAFLTFYSPSPRIMLPILVLTLPCVRCAGDAVHNRSLYSGMELPAIHRQQRQRYRYTLAAGCGLMMVVAACLCSALLRSFRVQTKSACVLSAAVPWKDRQGIAKVKVVAAQRHHRHRDPTHHHRLQHGLCPGLSLAFLPQPRHRC